MNNRPMRWGGALVVGALTTTAVLTAPVAAADQYDYLNDLDSNGVNYGATDMINLGKKVCASICNDPSFASVDGTLRMLVAAGFPSEMERSMIVGEAADHMCPDIWPALTAHRSQVQQAQS